MFYQVAQAELRHQRGLSHASLFSRLLHFNRGALRPKAPDNERVLQLKDRFLRLKDSICLRSFLSTWHMGVDAEHIKRENVRRFVALGYFEMVINP
jgi:hypothetical protein